MLGRMNGARIIIIIIIIKHLYSAMVPGNPVQRRCYKQKIKIKEKYKKHII